MLTENSVTSNHNSQQSEMPKSSVKQMKVELDNSSSVFHSPGELVTGVVQIEVSRECSSPVRLSVCGESLVKTCKKLRHNIRNYVYLKDKLVLSRDTLSPSEGSYYFPFSFILPPDIPSSLHAAEGCGCSVSLEYTLTCTCDGANKQTLVVVRRPWTLDDVRYLHGWSNDVTGSSLLPRPRKATMTVSLSRRAFVIGTPMSAHVQVTNHHGPASHKVTMKLKRVTVIMTSNGQCEFLATTYPNIVSKPLRVKARGSEAVDLDLQLLEDLQTSRLHGANGLDLFYILEVSLQDSSGERLGLVRTPVALCSEFPALTIAGPQIEADPESPKVPLPELPREVMRAIREDYGVGMAPPPYSERDPGCSEEILVGGEMPPPYEP